MNHQKHTDLTKQIETLKAHIKQLQDIRNDSIQDIESFEEALDKAEIELMNLDLEDEESEKEYLEHQQQEYDTRTDLENSQI